MKRALLVAATLAPLVLVGCGSSDEPEPDVPEATALPCSRPSLLLIGSIEEGLTVSGGGSLGRASSVEVPFDLQNSAGWPELLVAANLQGPGLEGGDNVAVWATSGGYGPISAVDETAREFSEWGAAAQPGSAAREAMDALRYSEAYEAVYACASG